MSQSQYEEKLIQDIDTVQEQIPYYMLINDVK